VVDTPRPKYPYRTADEPAPSSKGRSSRVLGALARLSQARGAHDDSESLSARARVARDSEGSRTLRRCIEGHAAIARDALAEAEEHYQSFLLAAGGPYTVLVADHLEVLGAYAAVSLAQTRASRGEEALRNAVVFARRNGDPCLHPDSPMAAAILLSATFRRLGEPEVAARILGATSGVDVRPLLVGAFEHAWAETSLALGELDAASGWARAASAVRYAALGPASPVHAATRALLGRVSLAQGQLEDAAHELRGALSDLQSLGQHDVLIEAEVEVAYATLLLLRHRSDDANAAARRAHELVTRAARGSYAATLPVLHALARLLPTAASAIAREVETIEATYRP